MARASLRQQADSARSPPSRWGLHPHTPAFFGGGIAGQIPPTSGAFGAHGLTSSGPSAPHSGRYATAEQALRSKGLLPCCSTRLCAFPLAYQRLRSKSLEARSARSLLGSISFPRLILRLGRRKCSARNSLPGASHSRGLCPLDPRDRAELCPVLC